MSQYSARELIRFQEEFKPLAKAYTSRLWTVVKLLVLLLLCLVPPCVSITYNFSYRCWLFGAGILICFVGIISLLHTARLTCTARHADLDAGLGSCCPECGGDLRVHSKGSKQWPGTVRKLWSLPSIY